MFCLNCGERLKDNEIFCHCCEKPIHNLKGNIFHPGVKKDNISCLSDIPKDILKKSSSSKTS